MSGPAPLRIAFVTSTPMNAEEGSGTFVGIQTLAGTLTRLGVQVDIVAPRSKLPVLTLTRLLFNGWLPFRRWNHYDVIVGFDLDGYRIAGRTGRPHVAAIKGVIADELRYERGLARSTLSLQARWEAYHVHHAHRVIATSRYSADRLVALYKLPRQPAIVPELIDLSAWRERFARHPMAPDPTRFVVLCVCRFYRRKRVDLLLRAAAQLKAQIPRFEVRIAGDGPERTTLHRLARSLQLSGAVRWLGSLDAEKLAGEYSRSDVFCLPSVQEGFGIVLLEAMAAGKPVVAAQAGAVPEVAPHGLLVAPDDWRALAGGIKSLYEQPQLRRAQAAAGRATVGQFDAPLVAQQFLAELKRVSQPMKTGQGALGAVQE
jgi:glycosyltransferase involved in cell wall biosynthesis